MDLHGKRVIVTGASSGLGREITVRLARSYGCRIAAAARHTESLADVPGEIYPINFDAGKKEDIDAMLDFAQKSLGGIDCVIACAGFGYFEHFENKSYEHIQNIYSVNLVSTLYILQRLLSMTEGRVSFTAISSALGKMGLAGYALYCGSKFALDGFARAYRYEKPGRLHFMTVYPVGLKKTRFFSRISDDMPLPRPLQDAGRAAAAAIWICNALVFAANRVLPFLFPVYQNIYRKKFEKWLEKSGGGHLDM